MEYHQQDVSSSWWAAASSGTSSRLSNLLRVAHHAAIAPLASAPQSARVTRARRVNVPAYAAHPKGRAALHAMDAMSMRRVEAVTWVFGELLDLDALEAGLERCGACERGIAGRERGVQLG